MPSKVGLNAMRAKLVLSIKSSTSNVRKAVTGSPRLTATPVWLQILSNHICASELVSGWLENTVDEERIMRGILRWRCFRRDVKLRIAVIELEEV